MRASHSVLLASDAPHDHHSNCLVTFSITPHMATKHLIGHTVKLQFVALLAGIWPMKSAWLRKHAINSVTLCICESVNTAAEASTTEAAKEVRYLLDHSVSLMLKLVSDLGPV